MELYGRKRKMKKTDLAEKIFDSVSKAYDVFLNFSTFGLINFFQNKLIDSTPIENIVLDVGTGTGEVLKKIKEKYEKTTLLGIDISENMLKTAHKKLPDAYFIKADAENFPLKEESINNIFYSLSFRHLNGENQIKQCKRVLKSKGTVSILDLNRSDFLMFLFGKIFRPVGKLLFSDAEYNYFLESIKEAKTIQQLIEEFEQEGFKTYYKKQYFFKTLIIVIFRKDS